MKKLLPAALILALTALTCGAAAAPGTGLGLILAMSTLKKIMLAFYAVAALGAVAVVVYYVIKKKQS